MTRDAPKHLDLTIQSHARELRPGAASVLVALVWCSLWWFDSLKGQLCNPLTGLQLEWDTTEVHQFKGEAAFEARVDEDGRCGDEPEPTIG